MTNECPSSRLVFELADAAASGAAPDYVRGLLIGTKVADLAVRF